MATASSLTAAKGRQNAFDTVSASSTDSSLVAAVSGHRIRVLGMGVSCGGTASTFQFESGTSTAISPVFNNSIVLPLNESGWFETNAGEALTVTTGAGSATAIIIVYEIILV